MWRKLNKFSVLKTFENYKFSFPSLFSLISFISYILKQQKAPNFLKDLKLDIHQNYLYIFSAIAKPSIKIIYHYILPLVDSVDKCRTINQEQVLLMEVKNPGRGSDSCPLSTLPNYYYF